MSRLQVIQRHYDKAGISGLAEWVSKLYYRKIASMDTGRSIFEEDWELCIILDGCRADLMQEVADNYPFLTNGDTAISV